MLFYECVAPLQKYLSRHKECAVGFVPTMGALHEGHLSLLRQSLAENDLSICSIFVNPTQFNDAEDLEKYPRMPERDRQMLADTGCDLLFMPAVEEVYPPDQHLEVDLDLGNLDKVMEGEFRPGHFRGVATVVKRLLDIVQPDRLYMGQKDFQQWTIVREMIRQLNLPVELKRCPIVREPDGLAMSSRNQRLSPEFRQRAPAIYQALLHAREQFEFLPPESIEKFALQEIKDAGLRPDYFEVVNGFTLLPVNDPRRHDFIVACAAAWAGEVRLIDNLILKA